MKLSKLGTGLALAVVVGLPAVSVADIPSQQDIDYFSVLGEQRRAAAEAQAREREIRFAGEEQRDADEVTKTVRQRKRGTDHYPYQTP